MVAPIVPCLLRALGVAPRCPNCTLQRPSARLAGFGSWSGNGVGLGVPSLLTWPGSCIVHHIKGENWTLTSGFRSRHGRVRLISVAGERQKLARRAARLLMRF
jgi:type IV secretory pathway TraG/TraD family ATPase VirD4